MLRRRVLYIVLAISTIAIGLIVHVRGAALGTVARDMIGDALWAAMITWWLGALVPRGRLAVRSVAAYAICAAVEASQLYHTPALDSARATLFGRLILGSGFDTRDLFAYALGVLSAALLEAVISGRSQRPREG
jgi:hypothetical protein